MSLGLIHRLAVALCLSLVTLYYPTHFWMPRFSGPASKPPVWQVVVGGVVQVLALPIALLNRLHVPHFWGLDVWFPQNFGEPVSRQELIVTHLVTGTVVYLALLYLPSLVLLFRLKRK
jgi:hypothetical protein